MALGVDYNGGFGYINASGNGSIQPVCLQTRGGNVGIGTTGPSAPLEVSGAVKATTFTTTSDYRTKTNIKLLDLDEYNVDKLRPVTYNLRSDNSSSIGLIAHEVQPYYPFLVSSDKDADITQSINYIGFIGVMIKEIQELKKKLLERKDQLNYGGIGEITNNEFVIITLPSFTKNMTTNYIVQLTPISSNKRTINLTTSEIMEDYFIVYGENTKFFWSVYEKS
jgi:hypothetical protein